MKLYTKTGDKGETGLYGGERRSKADLRVAAYGDVDELQALLGVVRGICADKELNDVLDRLQVDGFVLSSQLARPGTGGSPAITEGDVAWLEEQIDRFDAELPQLRTFILQGGGPLGSYLHLARTVCRRAERSIVALAAQEAVEPAPVMYVNRLSDLLFIMARIANHRSGQPETAWKSKS